MTAHKIAFAQQFVATLKLPPLPRPGIEAMEGGEQFDFSKIKSQALVVGSDVVSFVKGVTPEQRGDIVRSSLLAQLVAKKRVPDSRDIYKWYEEYFKALASIGWVIQDHGFSVYSESSEDFQTHQAILKVAAVLLGPAGTAFAVVKATLDALKDMSAESPWMTLFNRESQTANTARFQVMLVEQDDNSQFLVSVMAFGLKAKSTLTQVLFFKFRSNDVTLKHYSGKVTIDSTVLSAVRDAISAKIVNFAIAYIKALPELG